MGGPSKKGGAQITVTNYLMSMHYGICWGPVDELQAIYVGEKEAWAGSQTTKSSFEVSKPELFGGDRGEGGVKGTVHWLPGDPTQILPNELSGRLQPSATGAQVPGFRNVGSLFFIGGTIGTPGDEFSPPGSVAITTEGFTWGSNNPYLKSIWAKIKRKPVGLNPAYAMIGNIVEASISGYSITCDGVTDTVSANTAKVINGHSFTVNFSSTETQLIVDGLNITLTDNEDPETDEDLLIDIGGITTRCDYYDSIAVNGVKLVITSKTVFSLSFGSAGQDANPAHIVYECITNKDWGMGENPASIDTTSFENSAVTLFNEAFGMSMAWHSSSTIESFIGEVLDHVLGVVYTDPSTGLITMKLMRADYDPATIPVLTPDNCKITRFDRKGWGETVNEIVVTWTNPINEEEETVTVSNIANQAIQGNIVSESRNYYGIRNQALAIRVASRDLQIASTPLASFEIEVDRTFWDMVPGGVAKLVYPEEGIDGLIIRVGKIDYGKKASMPIKIDATEDVFGRPSASYITPTDTAWTDTSSDATPMTHTQFMTLPYYFVEQNVSAATLGTLEYPDVGVAVLASHSSRDVTSFDLYADTLKPNGDIVRTELGNRSTVTRATLAADLFPQAESTIYNLYNVTGDNRIKPNTFMFIGTNELTAELCLVTEVLLPVEGVHAGGIKIARGLLDTVPKSWNAGTPVWLFDAKANCFDLSIRSAGESVIYNLLTNTSKGRLSLDDAPDQTFTLVDRPWLPYRPANPLINGQGYSVDIGTATEMTATWSNRNRLMEPIAVLRWNEDTVAPETGQKTRIYVKNSSSVTLAMYDNINGSGPFVIPNTGWGSNSVLHVYFASTRDGVESLQAHGITVTRTP